MNTLISKNGEKAIAPTLASNKFQSVAYIIMGICILDFVLSFAQKNFMPQIFIVEGRDYTNWAIVLACYGYIMNCRSKLTLGKLPELLSTLLDENEKVILTSSTDVTVKNSMTNFSFGILVATNKRVLFIKTGQISGLLTKRVSRLDNPVLEMDLQISTLKNVSAGFSSLTFLDSDGLKRKITIGLGKASKWASVLNGKE